MSKKAFDKIAAGLNDALDIARKANSLYVVMAHRTSNSVFRAASAQVTEAGQVKTYHTLAAATAAATGFNAVFGTPNLSYSASVWHDGPGFPIQREDA